VLCAMHLKFRSIKLGSSGIQNSTFI